MKLPNCEICVHKNSCPCGYSCCNAACLTLFKKEEKEEKENNIPKYSLEVAKQLIFDCAMELFYFTEKLSNEEVGNKLLNIIHEMDKIKFSSKIKVKDILKLTGNRFVVIHVGNKKYDYNLGIMSNGKLKRQKGFLSHYKTSDKEAQKILEREVKDIGSDKSGIISIYT